MRWRSGRQHDRAITGGGELRRELARRLAIEADHYFQPRAQRVQPDEIVGGGVADAGVEAAFALAGAEHVPQAEAVRQQARQPLGIRLAGEILAGQRRQDRPQLVARVFSLTLAADLNMPSPSACGHV